MAVSRPPSPAAWLAPLLLLACLQASSVSGEDFYDRLLAQPAGKYASMDKKGMLPTSRFIKEQVDLEKFNLWLLNGTIFEQKVPVVPPLTFKCGVWVNHDYKFIFIRTRKAASTSIVGFFNGACRYTKADKPHCMEVLNLTQIERLGSSPNKLWKDYFVFAVARNPWARAASGYDYLLQRRRMRKSVCSDPTFEMFAADPMVIGKQSQMFGCYGDRAFEDFYHVEPSARCLTTKEADQSAIDYLIRYEHLDEDFAKAVEMINKRRPADMPAWENKGLRWRNKGSALHGSGAEGEEAGAGRAVAAAKGGRGGKRGPGWESNKWLDVQGSTLADSLGAAKGGDDGEEEEVKGSSHHTAKYRACGQRCVEQVSAFYKEDIDFFQFNRKP